MNLVAKDVEKNVKKISCKKMYRKVFGKLQTLWNKLLLVKGTQKGAHVPTAGNEERPRSFFQDWNAGRNAFYFWERNEERNALLKIEERLMLCSNSM